MEVDGGYLSVVVLHLWQRHFQARLDGSKTNGLAVMNRRLAPQGTAIDRGPVGRTGITDDNFPAVAQDLAMMSGDASVVDDESVIRRAPDGGCAIGQFERLAFEHGVGEDEFKHNYLPFSFPVQLASRRHCPTHTSGNQGITVAERPSRTMSRRCLKLPKPKLLRNGRHASPS